MLSRRGFLRVAATAPLALTACGGFARGPAGVRVNDVHSGLNATRVDRVVRVRSLEALQRVLREARERRQGVAIAGARHSMGGQQFLSGGLLVDTLGMNRVLGFDPSRGLLTVEAGILWPEVFTYLASTWSAGGAGWGIVQKQTGADELSLGGALASNVHGRGLTLAPIVQDVESLVLVSADGVPRRVSRTEHAELFGLAIGGYGLFGVITTLTLRLASRRKVERVATEAVVEDVIPELERRIADGHLYGDFQFGIDRASAADFLRRGVLSTYRPVPAETPIPSGQRTLSDEDWRRLLILAHTDGARALEIYLEHYLATSGQIYWADTQQLGFYQAGYHVALDSLLASSAGRNGVRTEPATEIITELYVPRPALAAFMSRARDVLRSRQVGVVYGTVRLIERDAETFLPWAKRPYACIIFNLHTPHDRAGIARSAAAFRELIDAALELKGSYYLTYHRFAAADQLAAAYPQFGEFLRQKLAHDPEERFQSDWYRHYRRLFA